MIDSTKIARYIELAQQVAAQYRVVYCAFISGSLIEGIGNSASDLDVFIVTPEADLESPIDAATFAFSEARVDISYADDIRIDTEVWTLKSIQDAAAQFREVSLADRPAMVSLDESRLQLAHRIKIGIPALNDASFASIRDLYNYSKLSMILANRFLVDYFGHAEDAVGAIDSGDGGTSLLTSRAALGSIVDAYLASYGETNAKAKWRVQKLRRHGDLSLLSSYMELESQAGIDDDALLASAKMRLRAASQLAQQTQQRLIDIKPLPALEEM